MHGDVHGAAGPVLGALSTTDVVVLVAAVVASAAALVCLVAAVVLVGAVRRLERGVETLRGEAVPLVSGARQAVEQANTDLELVGSVLESTEAVTSTVDSASRLAQRAFANPVVKLLAWRAGTVAGVRALRQGSGTGVATGTDGAPTELSAHRRAAPGVRSVADLSGMDDGESDRTSPRGRRSRMAG